MANQFNNQPYDPGTLIKLDLLRLYIKSWLPVFIQRNQIHWNKIYIYDFFGGSGKDSLGKPGSPLVILNELRNHCPSIIEKRLKIHFLINELDQSKSAILRNNVSEYLQDCRNKNEFSCCKQCSAEDDCPFTVEIKSKEFKVIFNELYPTIKINDQLPRFMFIDQFGIKEVTKDIFRKLTALKRTDFLFFISSSYFRRFAEMEEFSKYLEISKQQFDDSRPEHCHRIIFEYYKEQINNDAYFLAPFSIKKTSNIYGLIFGSNNPLGMEKFLDSAWALDKNTGEANFNIDNDSIISNGQFSIFNEDNGIKKKDVFERNMIEWLKKSERSNSEVYLFAMTNGMKKKHATEVLKKHVKSLSIRSDKQIRKGYFYLDFKPTKKIKISFNE